MGSVRAIPGTYLGSTLEYQSGEGTYVRDGSIYASVIGVSQAQAVADGKKSILYILLKRKSGLAPRVSQMVIARVIKINARHATIRILIIEDHTPCQTPYKGILR
jgi:exosome complex RNA-binding protein Csl4